ncbi:SOS response-associated peptidase family protein [Microbacterium sp. No. 7]|uniref:SOS response-associated peptidase family protein n=1 Tax=Microbacterium sp. No. 7 TaxID=1714373 RepID=UPI0006D0DE1C|nr:SOS response-associated peptidase family protein [Microbacterium sp. No. 7]ALJ22030.1 hypothetical protein AOA12_19900 [Microbacterium sp. No. 7]
MCASYGLDPRFADEEWRDAVDRAVLDDLRTWAEENNRSTLRPTGIRARNLNPIIQHPGSLTLAWWGYLVDGKVAPFPSINSRAERLSRSRRPLGGRAIVPASHWLEMQKPSRVWHELAAPGDRLLGMAAVTRPGHTADGREYVCYSLVMHPAAEHIADVHDRMPLLVAPGFADEWLTSDAPAAELLATAAGAAQDLDASIIARPQASDTAPAALF